MAMEHSALALESRVLAAVATAEQQNRRNVMWLSRNIKLGTISAFLFLLPLCQGKRSKMIVHVAEEKFPRLSPELFFSFGIISPQPRSHHGTCWRGCLPLSLLLREKKGFQLKDCQGDNNLRLFSVLKCSFNAIQCQIFQR